MMEAEDAVDSRLRDDPWRDSCCVYGERSSCGSIALNVISWYTFLHLTCIETPPNALEKVVDRHTCRLSHVKFTKKGGRTEPESFERVPLMSRGTSWARLRGASCR